jgi:hypothetical protein
VEEISVTDSFYDDPDYVSDADRDSKRLKRWHCLLLSKELPSGERLEWAPEPGGYLTATSSAGPLRVSSDTIATTHAGYRNSNVPQWWGELAEEQQDRYERAFYTIGGFIVFPTRPQSLNQRRGTDWRICDRFDLTLECIRRFYLGGGESPLADVIRADANYFGLFGDGADGFRGFVDFFHLQDLIEGDSVRWLSGAEGDDWDFDGPPLPTSAPEYRTYLDNVLAFVTSRNDRIQEWCRAQP